MKGRESMSLGTKYRRCSNTRQCPGCDASHPRVDIRSIFRRRRARDVIYRQQKESHHLLGKTHKEDACRSVQFGVLVYELRSLQLSGYAAFALVTISL